MGTGCSGRLRVMWRLPPGCFLNNSANSREGVGATESGAGDTMKVLPLRAREPMADKVGGDRECSILILLESLYYVHKQGTAILLSIDKGSKVSAEPA